MRVYNVMGRFGGRDGKFGENFLELLVEVWDILACEGKLADLTQYL